MPTPNSNQSAARDARQAVDNPAGWMRRHRATVQAGKDLRRFNIQRIMSGYELESDEGGTAYDKAAAIATKEVA